MQGAGRGLALVPHGGKGGRKLDEDLWSRYLQDRLGVDPSLETAKARDSSPPQHVNPGRIGKLRPGGRFNMLPLGSFPSVRFLREGLVRP
jgi:hypothetical protein